MSKKPEIFVGRLPPGTTAEQLRPIFEAYGEVAETRMLGGQNCGFVTFTSFNSAELALENVVASGALGEAANVNWANSRPTGAVDKGAPSRPPEKKLFIGSLHPGVTEADLLANFGPFGRISEAKMVYTNPQRPCGFVTFETFAETERAIEQMHDHPQSPLCAEGKPLVVKFADGRPAGAAPAGGPIRNVMHSVPIHQSAPLAVMHSQPPPAGTDKVFFGNLPPDVSDDFLRGMMVMFSGVTSVKVYRKTPTSKPAGFVTFQNAALAQHCIDALNGSANGAAMGMTLNVSWAQNSGQKRPAGQDFAEAPMAQQRRTVTAQAAHVAQMPAAFAQVQPPPMAWPAQPQAIPPSGMTSEGLPEKVFIGGLPHGVSEQDIASLCANYGILQSVRLIQAQSKPTIALVQYTDWAEAHGAIGALNGYQAFEEKGLQVKFANPLRNPGA